MRATTESLEMSVYLHIQELSGTYWKVYPLKLSFYSAVHIKWL